MIYENQYIGAFIYSLGVIAGRENEIIADSINLLQQTPHDKTYNDLMGNWNGKNFIIEFKRNESLLAKEQLKVKFIHLVKDINSGNKLIGQISIRGHFICYPKNENNRSFLAFKRYVLMNHPKEKTVEHQKFIQLLKENGSVTGISNSKEFEIYLRYLIQISAGEPTSGIVVIVGADGTFRFLVFDSYTELGMRLGLIKQQVLDQSINQNKKQQEKREPKIGI